MLFGFLCLDVAWVARVWKPGHLEQKELNLIYRFIILFHRHPTNLLIVNPFFMCVLEREEFSCMPACPLKKIQTTSGLKSRVMKLFGHLSYILLVCSCDLVVCFILIGLSSNQY